MGQYKILKKGIHYTCIAVIIIDSIMRMDKKYSLPPPTYLECKHAVKKEKDNQLDSSDGSVSE